MAEQEPGAEFERLAALGDSTVAAALGHQELVQAMRQGQGIVALSWVVRLQKLYVATQQTDQLKTLAPAVQVLGTMGGGMGAALMQDFANICEQSGQAELARAVRAAAPDQSPGPCATCRSTVQLVNPEPVIWACLNCGNTWNPDRGWKTGGSAPAPRSSGMAGIGCLVGLVLLVGLPFYGPPLAQALEWKDFTKDPTPHNAVLLARDHPALAEKAEKLAWETVHKTDQPLQLRHYLTEYPKGHFRKEATRALWAKAPESRHPNAKDFQQLRADGPLRVYVSVLNEGRPAPGLQAVTLEAVKTTLQSLGLECVETSVAKLADLVVELAVQEGPEKKRLSGSILARTPKGRKLWAYPVKSEVAAGQIKTGLASVVNGALIPQF